MEEHARSQTSAIARSAGTVSFAVFLSRILGLIREQVFAALFGAGYAYDAFVVAYRIPNLLRDLFAEGALSAAFVTVFTDYRTKKGAAVTWGLANNVITTLIVIVGLITVCGMLFSGSIVSLISPDFSLIPGKHELTTAMTTIMFPFLLLVSLSAVAMGILNSMGRFFIPSMASSFFNLGSIVSGVALAYIFFLMDVEPIIGMAIGTLIGGALQLLVQVPQLKLHGFSFRPYLHLRDDGLRRIMTLMLPAIVGLSATQINIFVNTFFASSCPEGSVSWLNYAFRLIMFPIGVVGVSLSVATLPVVSTHASTGDIPRIRDTYVSSAVLSFILTVPASAGLIFLAHPIVRLIFEHGRFTAYDTINTAQALSLYAAGLFAYAALKIIVPVFYALNSTRYPVLGSFLTVLLNILFVTLTLETLLHRAIALSMSLCVTVNFLFLSFFLYRALKGYNYKYLVKSLLKITALSLIMGAGAWWLNGMMEAVLGDSVVGQIGSLAIAMAAAMAFYFSALSFMKIDEVSYLSSRILSKLKGKPAA